MARLPTLVYRLVYNKFMHEYETPGTKGSGKYPVLCELDLLKQVELPKPLPKEIWIEFSEKERLHSFRLRPHGVFGYSGYLFLRAIAMIKDARQRGYRYARIVYEE